MKENPETGGVVVIQTAAPGNLRQGDFYKNGLDCISKLKAAWTAQGALSQKKQKYH